VIGNNYTLSIKEEAKADIKHATKWYGDIENKLALRLINELDYILKTILYNPKTYKKVYKNFRQAALHKFPFVLLYEQDSEEVIIYSLFHTRQNPIKKLKRLRK
jgi:plasmid stabilization system protein ParE